MVIKFQASLCLVQAQHFDRDDVALQGISRYFKRLSDGEMERVERLMKLQNKRGGRILLQDIERPKQVDWGSAVDAMKASLAMEKAVNTSLLKLHEIADKHGDPHLLGFLQNHYLTKQVEIIEELAVHVTNLKRVGPGHGEWNYSSEI